MNEHKISNLQLFSLTFFLGHFFFLFYGNKIILVSGNDTLFACILGFFINIIFFKLFLFFRKKYQKKKIPFQKTIWQFFGVLCCILCFFILRDSSIFVKLNFLEEGNLFQIALLLILISYIISKRNISQVASLSLICFFIFIFLFGTNILGMSNHLTIQYLKPPFTKEVFSLIKGAMLFSFYSLFPCFLLSFIPYHQVENKKSQNKYLYFALIISNLIVIIQYAMLCFGPSLMASSTYSYPYMLIIHKISSFLILDRISYLLSIYVLFDATILLGVLFTIIKMSFANKYNQVVRKVPFVKINH